MASETMSIPYRCPNCQEKVGELVEVDGAARLNSGTWLIAEGRRFCHRCGRAIHFRPPRESWAELAARHKARQMEPAACPGQ